MLVTAWQILKCFDGQLLFHAGPNLCSPTRPYLLTFPIQHWFEAANGDCEMPWPTLSGIHWQRVLCIISNICMKYLTAISVYWANWKLNRDSWSIIDPGKTDVMAIRRGEHFKKLYLKTVCPYSVWDIYPQVIFCSTRHIDAGHQNLLKTLSSSLTEKEASWFSLRGRPSHRNPCISHLSAGGLL